DISWSYSGNSELTVDITDRVATITAPSADWNGSETITFTATDTGLLTDSDDATFTVTEGENNPPVAVIIAIDDDIIPIPVSIRVTPQTLNLERLGNWVKVHVCNKEGDTTQESIITLDGSGSYDPDGDNLTYNWTLIGPEGEITVDDVETTTVTLSAGTYTVNLVVNDGNIDSTSTSETFTLTYGTIDEIVTADPKDFTLNGVPGSKVQGSGNCIVISFADEDVVTTIGVGLDVEMTLMLEGSILGVDYIDVIQDKGKSDLKSEITIVDQNEEQIGSADNGKGNKKETAPGQTKNILAFIEPGNKGKGDAPGQNKDPRESANGKGKDDAPGQNKESGEPANGKGKGKN
ncbi:MAG TPA: hypothetical protein G4O15_01880, partial [Dehalococcoidia bacterium]|nr:hypothetical protein [Dehalococcoidia bacterium]